MFHFFKLKNAKTKQFDSGYEQCNEAYMTIVDSASVHTPVNDFKIDINKGRIADIYPYYTNKTRMNIQKLRELHADVSTLEPQTDDQVLQREDLRIKINEQLIDLHEFIDWVIIVRIANNQGYIEGLRDAEEKSMD